MHIFWMEFNIKCITDNIDIGSASGDITDCLISRLTQFLMIDRIKAFFYLNAF